MKYTTVIGLEIHAELLTATKVFCGCANSFTHDENVNCCPVCVGLPGALPVLNRRAMEQSVTAGLALGCEISEWSRWDRKNYFYPDSPKAYQISQLYAPFCAGGGLEIDGRFIRINHIHLEEDAGKLVHDGLRGVTRIDYNRCGVPLIEIVTEPDIRSAKEAAAFVELLRQTLVYAGVCDGRMEQGSMRVDANVSVMPLGSDTFGTRTETKNLNSFKHITAAIEYEAARQIELLESGGRVVQETRRYHEAENETSALRSKEDAQDYRYVPDPDILPLEIAREEVARLRGALPELPQARRERYAGWGLKELDIDVLLAKKATSDYLDEVVKLGAPQIAAANIIRTDLLEKTLPPADLARILELGGQGRLDVKPAVAAALNGKNIDDLIVVGDDGAVDAAVAEVLASRPDLAEQYRNGEVKVFGFLMGLCSKQLKGKALPQAIKAALEKGLNNV
ncbi:aspartyl/glutamyl-tRNA(Asn/Gln) amidotransferase subunit B [Clostridia bacterium]|nr:aspartyl/glutamyl-tRNA(Asn/Gln) amidotransferase subunit B [Clostridia bacterium]